MPAQLPDPRQAARAEADHLIANREALLVTSVERVLADSPAVKRSDLLAGLEAFHAESPTAATTTAAVAAAIPQLGHADRGVRFAARIALGEADVGECDPVDGTEDGVVTIAELIGGVGNALCGCGEEGGGSASSQAEGGGAANICSGR